MLNHNAQRAQYDGRYDGRATDQERGAARAQLARGPSSPTTTRLPGGRGKRIGGGGAGIGLTSIQDRDEPGPQTHARASWSTSSVLPTWYVLSSQVEEECARHSAASQVAVKLPPSA